MFFLFFISIAWEAFGQKSYEQKLVEANELIHNGKTSNKLEDLAEGYFRRGKLADGLGNFKEAADWFQKARMIYVQKGASPELARVLLRLSALEFQQKHDIEALRLINESIKVAHEYKNDRALFMGYASRGQGVAEVALRHGDTLKSFKRVMKDFLLAEKYAKKIDDLEGLNDLYLLYGGVFSSYKKHELGLKLYQKILPNYEKKAFEQPKIIFYLNLASSFIENGNLNESLRLLKIVEPIIKNPSFNDFSPKLRFEEVAAAYQEASGNHKNATIHYRSYKDLKEKAVSQDHDNQISKLNRLYDLKARDVEISQNKTALKTEKKLRNTEQWLLIITMSSLVIMGGLLFYLYRLYSGFKQVSTRNAILVHEQNHRVKNNLQVISSMLNIQANMSNDNEITETIHEIKLRIDSMIQLQKQLYANDLTGLINLKILVNELIQSATFNFEISNLQFKVDFEKEQFDMDLTMTLALIINELITNACKYAFRDQKKPELNLRLTTLKKCIIIYVKDNGLHPIKNTNLISENSSFGFKMINMLLQQVDGMLNYSYENGSIFTITLKTNGKN